MTTKRKSAPHAIWMPDRNASQMSDEEIKATPMYRMMRKFLAIPARSKAAKGMAITQDRAEAALIASARLQIMQLYMLTTGGIR